MNTSKFKHYANLVLFRTYADLCSQTARTYLSYLWWVLDPLFYMLTLYIVFGKLLQRGTADFVEFLLIGVVTWRWLHTSLRRSCDILMTNAGLLQRIYVPKLVFPAVAVLSDTVKFMIVFILLVIFIAFVGHLPTYSWAGLILLILLQLMLICGFAFIFSAITPFVPDFRLLVDSALTFIMFLSGVFYDPSRIPQPYQDYFFLNPIAILIESYRVILINGSFPDISRLIYVFGVAFFAMLVGCKLLHVFDRMYPKIV